MASVVLRPEDEGLIEELLERLDPAKDSKVAPLAARMEPANWAFFVDYLRHDFRRQAQMAMIMKAVVSTTTQLGLADHSGVEKLLATDGLMLPNFGKAWEQSSRAHKEAKRYLDICNALRRAGNDETAAPLNRLTEISDELCSTILGNI